MIELRILYIKFSTLFFESRFSIVIFFILLVALFSRGFPAFNFLYFVSPILFGLYFVLGLQVPFHEKKIRLFFSIIFLFSLWAAITSLWSDYPKFTLSRSIYFFLITCSSVFIGYYLAKFNIKKVLHTLLLLNLLVVLLSIFSLIAKIPADAWTGGHGLGFMGFTNHQNKLGQYIYLTSAPLILFIKKPFLTDKKNYFYFTILITNIIILTLSVSRASILALFFVWFTYFLITTTFYKTIIFTVLFSVIIATTMFVTSNFFDNEKITLTKHENNFGDRRYRTIIDSWEAAKNGGLFGIGYGISDERFKDPLLGYYDNTSEGEIYKREKTVSFLALIEEVGVVGLLIFLIIIIYPIMFITKRLKLSVYFFHNYNPEARIQNPVDRFLIFNFSFLISLLVYAQIESWWIGIGSAVLPIYFIFSGSILGIDKN